MHGEGHLKLRNGKIYKGIWSHGQIEGFVQDMKKQEEEWNGMKAREEEEKRNHLEIRQKRKQEKLDVWSELQYFKEHNFLAWLGGLRLLEKLHEGKIETDRSDAWLIREENDHR